MSDPIRHWHRETAVDGFSKLDGTVRFYAFVRAAMLRRQVRRVLDFGAGRGAFWFDDTSLYRRDLRDLRASGATVTACDVDPAVLEHPCSDHKFVIQPDGPLPFGDASFNVIVADMVFEHIANPRETALELLRVLKPGGVICARTPNRIGYVALTARLIPASRHTHLLRSIQPDRLAHDVFAKYYRLNSPREVRNAFAGCHVHHYYESAEPAYCFANRLIYGAMLAVHAILPPPLATTICFFITKPETPC